MSSNKTIIPGMENAYTEHQNFGPQNTNVKDGTYVPNPHGIVSPNANIPNQKPIVGFLYSISKTNAGEFWPLHIGSNRIGRSVDSDVFLGEATISEQHAVLVIQQMKNPEKVIAWINDSGSTCGTMVNGERMGFDRRECFNGDIITIGEHYDLFFILIDAKQIGLNVCRDFMSTNQTSKNNYAASHLNAQHIHLNNNATQGYESGNIESSGGTVGVNDSVGSEPSTKPGGTIFL